MLRVQVHQIALAALITFVVGAAPALAQLNTQHLRGSVGLKAGSQPPPHMMTFLATPLHLPAK